MKARHACSSFCPPSFPDVTASRERRPPRARRGANHRACMHLLVRSARLAVHHQRTYARPPVPAHVAALYKRHQTRRAAPTRAAPAPASAPPATSFAARIGASACERRVAVPGGVRTHSAAPARAVASHKPPGRLHSAPARIKQARRQALPTAHIAAPIGSAACERRALPCQDLTRAPLTAHRRRRLVSTPTRTPRGADARE